MIDATRSGDPGPSTLLVLGSVGATIAVLGFLTWVSIAKPWGTTRRGPRRDRSSHRAPARTFLLATAPPFVDYAASLALGFPAPFTATTHRAHLPRTARTAHDERPSGGLPVDEHDSRSVHRQKMTV